MQNNNMSTAALILGIVSIVMSLCFGAGFFIGLIGITLALLSRYSRMNKSALIGLFLSIGGIIISVIIWVVLIVFLSMSDVTDFNWNSGNRPDDSIYYFNDEYDTYDDYDYYDEYYGFNEYYDFFNDNFYNDDYFNYDYNDNNYEGDYKL